MRYLTAAALALITLAGCTSPEERLERHLQQVSRHLEAANVALASVEARNAVQLAPEDARSHHALARVQQYEEAWPASLRSLERAYQLDPADAAVRHDLAALHLLRGDARRALALAEELLAERPADPAAMVLSASAHLQLGDLEAAEALARRALDEDPAHADAHAALAAAAFSRGHIEEATARIDRGIAQSPASLPLQLIKVQIAHATGNDAMTEAALQSILTASPDHMDGYRMLAAWHFARGDTDAGMAVLHDAVARMPDRLQPRLALAEATAERSLDGAIELLEGWVATTTFQDPRLDLRLADLYVQAGSLETAARAYEALAPHPDTELAMTARVRLTETLMALGRTEEARLQLDAALTAHPTEPRALYLLGRLQLDAGQAVEALNTGRTLATFHPDRPTGFVLQGDAYRHQQRSTLARERYQRARDLEPDHEPALRGLIALHLDAAEAAQAERLLAELSSASPTRDRLAAELANVRLAAGDWSAARALLAGPLAGQVSRQTVDVVEALRLAQAGDRSTATHILTDLLSEAPEHTVALSALGTVHREADTPAELTQALNEIIVRNPVARNPRLALVQLHASLGQWPPAMAAAAGLIERHPRWLPGHLAYIDVLGYAGRLADAQAAVEQATRIADGDVRPELILAGWFERAERWQESRALYRAILTRRPDTAIAANNLASLMMQGQPPTDQLAEALAIASTLADTDHPVYLDTLGTLQALNGRTEAAADTLRRALELEPDNRAIACHLALVLGDRSSAAGRLPDACAGAGTDGAFVTRWLADA